MSRAYIGVGSNLDNPSGMVGAAIEQLATYPAIRLIERSSLYETEPVGITHQPWFINAVVGVETPLTAAVLLERLLALENRLGRVRRVRHGPRRIDLDLLFYDQLVLHTEQLTVPHPQAHRRGFVLVPLTEIAPNLVHPVLGKTVQVLLHELPTPATVRLLQKD